MDNENGSTLQDVTGAIGSLGGTAGGIIGALRGGNKSAPAPAAAPQKSNMGLILGIGAAVLGVILLVLVAGRK